MKMPGSLPTEPVTLSGEALQCRVCDSSYLRWPAQPAATTEHRHGILLTLVCENCATYQFLEIISRAGITYLCWVLGTYDGSSGSVYFIQRGPGGPIKIGFSTNVVARIGQLQTAAPERLILLGTVPGTPALERALHGRFGMHALGGEWFAPHQDIRSYLADRLRAGASE